MSKPRKIKQTKIKHDYWAWTRPIVFSASSEAAFGAYIKQRLKELEKEHGKNAPPTKPT